MSTSSSSVQPGVLLGMGNPLLDISAAVKKEFIEKYNLKANDAILYEKEDIYDDLKENYGSTIEHITGGATQNSVRQTYSFQSTRVAYSAHPTLYVVSP